VKWQGTRFHRKYVWLFEGVREDFPDDSYDGMSVDANSVEIDDADN
jgi:hypothetical protein